MQASEASFSAVAVFTQGNALVMRLRNQPRHEGMSKPHQLHTTENRTSLFYMSAHTCPKSLSTRRHRRLTEPTGFCHMFVAPGTEHQLSFYEFWVSQAATSQSSGVASVILSCLLVTITRKDRKQGSRAKALRMFRFPQDQGLIPSDDPGFGFKL